MTGDNRIFSVLPVLPDKISGAVRVAVFSGVSFEEIRLRRGMPVGITSKGKSLFLAPYGTITDTAEKAIKCGQKDFEATLLKICENSVFAHTKEIESGYISMPGGIRVGVCGDFSPSLWGINSVNIRIPRQVTGCADEVFSHFCGGMLLVGPPGCGKTTMLRELIRKLSAAGYRVSVIDSRREISGGAEISFDLGPNTDVLYITDRAFGAMCALRTMYPQIIAFDEIGTQDEVDSVTEAFNSGVHLLTTAHAGSTSELKRRPVTKRLLESGTLNRIVLLSKNIGERPQIYDTEVVLNEVGC